MRRAAPKAAVRSAAMVRGSLDAMTAEGTKEAKRKAEAQTSNQSAEGSYAVAIVTSHTRVLLNNQIGQPHRNFQV